MSSSVAEIPTMAIDMSDWDFNQDPYPTLETARELGPVVYNEHDDLYVVTSYRNCAKVLGNTRQFDSHKSREVMIALFGGVTMGSMVGEQHRQVRGIWAKDFERETLDAQKALVERVVAEQVDPLVERVRAGETVDAIPTMARTIPVLVIANMLGIETEMHEQFAEWSNGMGASLEGPYAKSPRREELFQIGADATAALNDHMAEVIVKRREQPSEDLVGRMVGADYASQMTEQELIAGNTQLVFAGNETTTKLIAATIVALAEHPDQRRALVEDRSLIPQTLEEVHRWRTIVGAIPRHACSDESEIEGIPIPREAQILPLMMAGNRDPERWERPDQFDIFRERKQHLGFGFGMHVCLGMNLARLEAGTWLNRWLDLLPDYELAGPIEYATTFLARAPEAVPVALG